MNDYIRITKRRLIATAALTLAVFAMVVALPSDSADATHYEGSYQDITWTIDDGVMVISGSGSIPLQKSYSGWNNYLSSVTELIIEEGITGWSSGNVSQFTGIDGLQAASFPDSLVVGGVHFLPNVTFYDIDGTTEI